MKWWVYLLRCSDSTLYCGITNNPKKRMEKHNAGKASKYTRARLPVRPIYWEPTKSKSVAMKREAEIKKLTRDEKLRLVYFG